MRRTGHIRERSPGSYELRYSLGINPATGRRKIATATVRGSRKDAERELRKRLVAVDKGDRIDPTKITAGEWFDRWLAITRPEISPATYEHYRRFVESYLIPSLPERDSHAGDSQGEGNMIHRGKREGVCHGGCGSSYENRRRAIRDSASAC